MWLVTFRGYDWKVDLVVLILWVMAIALAFDLRAVRRGLTLRSLSGPVVLAAFYLALPSQLGEHHGGRSANPPAVLCSVRLLGQGSVRRCYLLAGLFAVVVALRTGSIATAWGRISSRLEAEAKVFPVLPRRAPSCPSRGLRK